MAWVNLNTIYATKSEVNSKVPNTRTINGKALSSNVTLGASDIKLSDNTTLQSAWDSISPTTTEVNGLHLARMGNIVICEMYSLSFKLNGSWDTYHIGEVPDGFKPKRQIRQKVTIRDYDNDYSLAFWINSAKHAYIGNFGGNGFNGSSEANMTCCWEVA